MWLNYKKRYGVRSTEYGVKPKRRMQYDVKTTRRTPYAVRRTQKGFTLLEVLVSIAIMGMIMVLVWSSTSQTLNSKERIEKRDMIYQNGRVAIQKLTDDLTMAFLIKKPAMQTTITPRPITFFIGEDEGSRDALKFTSFSHMRFFSGAKQSDQCKLAYEVVSAEGERTLYNIVRREQSWLDADAEAKGNPVVVAEGVKDFELEYYDSRKEEWGKVWNTEKIDYAGLLPIAVRIMLSFEDPDDENKEIAMSTIVLLPMSTGAIDF